jgi:hypothetical protein
MLYGVGINDADYPVCPKDSSGKQHCCKYYKTWEAMLRRCYYPANLQAQPTYQPATVCDDWLRFSNFRNWMADQEWEGKCIDKDLLDWQNKVYSPETCLFISLDVNNLLCLARNARGPYPLGVCYHKASKKFVAQIVMYGKKTHLGLFTNFMDAHERYKLEKLTYIAKLADAESNPKIKGALLALK